MTAAWLLAGALAAAGAAALALAPRSRPRPRDRAAPSGRRRAVTAVAALLAAAAVAGLRGTHLVVAVLLGLAVVAVSALLAQAREARQAEERRQRVTDYCEALLGELRAGLPVSRAVERSVRVWSETEPVAAAARLGADVPLAFRRLGELPGAEELVRLAAAWELCGSTGSGLAFAVEQVLETARAEQAVARLVRSELASARATARLVTALPVVVLLAAQGIGARPWHFLLSTVPGLACLGAGLALALAGLWWIDRIAAAAARGV